MPMLNICGHIFVRCKNIAMSLKWAAYIIAKSHLAQEIPDNDHYKCATTEI